MVKRLPNCKKGNNMTVKEFITQENLPAWVADDIRAFRVADMKDAWNKALEGKQWHLLKWIIINGGIISHFPDLRRALGSFILMGRDFTGKTIWHRLPIDCHLPLAVVLTSNSGDLPYEWLKEARAAIRECWFAAVRDFRGAVRPDEEGIAYRRMVATHAAWCFVRSYPDLLGCDIDAILSANADDTSLSWFYGQFRNPFKG